MAKMTLMDFLPGILGLVGGAVSPQAGEAGATTLEMADQFKQRHRRQALMDEEAARRTVSDERAARAEERSIQSFEWARSDQLAQDQVRQRAEAERARALNAFGKMKEQLAAEGYAIPAEYAEWTPDTEESVQQAGREIRTLASNTPMSAEDADAWSAKLKGEGRVVYAPVRRNGIVSKEMLGAYPTQGRSGLPEGTTTLFGNAQAIDTAKLSLEQANEDVHDTTVDQFAEGREDAGVDGPLKVGFGEGNATAQQVIDSEVVPDTQVQDQAVETAQLKLMQAIQDFVTTGTLRPEAMELFMKMNAGAMGRGLPAAGAAGAAAPSKEKNVRPEVVSALVAKHSGR